MSLKGNRFGFLRKLLDLPACALAYEEGVPSSTLRDRCPRSSCRLQSRRCVDKDFPPAPPISRPRRGTGCRARCYPLLDTWTVRSMLRCNLGRLWPYVLVEAEEVGRVVA